MAKDKKEKNIVIEIGSSGVKLIELVKEKDKLLLDKADLVKIQDGAPGGFQEGALFKALQDLCARNHLDGVSVGVVLSGELAFVKLIKIMVPKGKSLNECLKPEVERVLPFAEKDVLWDFCVLNEETSGLAKVFLIAIKKDALDLRVHPLERLGPKIAAVSLAPLSLLNLAFFNEEHLGDKFFMMLNVGKEGSDLVVSRGSDILVRNLPYYDDVEEVKKEIIISLEHVKYEWGLKPEEAKLEGIIITGDVENLNDLRNAISSSFGAEAHRLEAFKGIDISKVPTASEDAFAASVGLASDLWAKPRFDVNLIRSTLKEKSEAKEKKIFLRASVALASLSIILGWYLLQKQTSFKREVLSEITAAVGQHKTQAEQAKSLKLERDMENEKMLTIINEIQSRSLPLQALSQIAPAITAKVWLTQFDFSYAGFGEGKEAKVEENLKVSGYADSYDDLNNFLNSLKASAYFKKIRTISSRVKPTKGEGESEMIEFNLALKIEAP